MKVNFLRIFFVLFVLLSLSGCKTLQEASNKEQLDAKLNIYGKTVRWGALENLYGFLSPEDSADVIIPKNLDNIRVTDYVVRVPPHLVDLTKATQTAEINYLFRDQHIIRTLVDYQEWRYDEKVKNWYRSNPIPEFK